MEPQSGSGYHPRSLEAGAMSKQEQDEYFQSVNEHKKSLRWLYITYITFITLYIDYLRLIDK